MRDITSNHDIEDLSRVRPTARLFPGAVVAILNYRIDLIAGMIILPRAF